MDFKNINWKNTAIVIGLLLTASIYNNGVNYFDTRYTNPGSIIPESILVQASRPYLVALISSLIVTIVAWTSIYLSKFKAVVAAGLLYLAFDYINFNIIGESWGFKIINSTSDL